MGKYFERIKNYLNKPKGMMVEMGEHDHILWVTVSNDWEEKYFYIMYGDLEHELPCRPMWHHYSVSFEMPNQSTPDGSCLVTIFDSKWFVDEESVVDYLKYRITKYRHISEKRFPPNTH